MMRLSAPAFDALPGIGHGFFTRQGGVSEGIYSSLNIGLGSRDKPEHVIENRRRVTEAMDAVHLITVHQHHSADVVVVDGPFDGPPPKADAMVTRNPDVALGILTADCGPLLFADPVARVIGAAHAGWGGAFKGIAEATLDCMEGQGADRSRIHVVLGPTLAQESYEVGPEFVERFVAENDRNRIFFMQPDGAERPFFDLPGYIASRLGRAGVDDRFTDLKRDTYAQPELFFSYRRSVHLSEPNYGRLVACVKLI